MATLYVTEQGSILRKTGDRIIVEKDDQVLLEVPCHKVDTVLIFGAVQVTIQALSELLEHEIELALFTRHGRLKGQLTPIKSKNIVLRVAQFERVREGTFALQTARELVRAKIGNAIAVLRRFAYNHPERKAALDAEVARLQTHLTSLDKAPDLAALNGLEGIAGRAYFAGFAQMILADLPFPGRRRVLPPIPSMRSCRSATRSSGTSCIRCSTGWDSIRTLGSCTRSTTDGRRWRLIFSRNFGIRWSTV